MDTAFHLLLPVPSPAAFVSPGDHASSAGDAPDARVAVVVERVIRQFVSHDIIPHLPAGPGGQRVDLDQAVSRVPFNDADVGSRRRLISPERRDPGVVAPERPTERLGLSGAAGAGRGAFVKGRAGLAGVLFPAHTRA